MRARYRIEQSKPDRNGRQRPPTNFVWMGPSLAALGFCPACSVVFRYRLLFAMLLCHPCRGDDLMGHLSSHLNFSFLLYTRTRAYEIAYSFRSTDSRIVFDDFTQIGETIFDDAFLCYTIHLLVAKGQVVIFAESGVIGSGGCILR